MEKHFLKKNIGRIELKKQEEGLREKPTEIGKIAVYRHEEPFYKDIGHDLKPKGVEEAKRTGKELKKSKFFNTEKPVFSFHSPKPRAKGTLYFIIQAAGLPDENINKIHALRPSDMYSWEAFSEKIEEFDHNQESIAEYFHTHLDHQEGKIIEPHQFKKRRFYRAFARLLLAIEKKHVSDNEISQILSVSHFELLTHLVHDVFGIENVGGYNSPSFGEGIFITVFKNEKPKTFLLEVKFRDFKNTVIFDTLKKEIKQLNSPLD